MNTIETTINSKVLGKTMNLAVYCPEGFEDRDIPVLYFLHGRTGNESILKQLGMDKTAGKLIAAGEIEPMIIVCPNMDNSRGINSSEKIGGHMPAIDLSYADEDECYFADEAMWKKYDPITIAENNSLADIEVFLDDGESDEGQFYRACGKLTLILEQKGVKVQNHLYEGHHDVEYVMSNIENYLRFYSRKMK